MAFILDLSTDNRCYLNAHHSFGRLVYAVNTVLSGPQISKHHAIIEWHNNCWYIRDLSCNGTWINNTKLKKNTRSVLKSGDKLFFATPNTGGFLIANLDAPCDLLIPNEQATIVDAICLNQYHFLPNEQRPEMVIFKNAEQQWLIERLGRQVETSVALNENDIIEFGGLSWQLKLKPQDHTTLQLCESQLKLHELSFIFDLSLDEEQTKLKIKTPDDTIDMLLRSHHYLILNLARYRAADALKGIDNQLQGWVYPEQLMKDIGIDYSYLNIQIHRARKQFADSIDIEYEANDTQSLVQRLPGKLRFGGTNFKIYKGAQLECELKDAKYLDHNNNEEPPQNPISNTTGEQ